MNATFLFLLFVNFTFFNLHVAFNRYPSFVCLRHGTAVFPLLLIAMGSNSPSFQAVLGSSMLSKIEQGITYSIAVPTKSSPNSKPLSASHTEMFNGSPARCTPKDMLVQESVTFQIGFKSFLTLHD